MYVNRAKKLAFVANPRTASHAVAEALKGVGFEPCHNHHDGIYQQAYSVYDHDSPITPENRSEWTVFCVVRNPWDTVVSWCLQAYQGKMPVPETYSVAEMEYALETARLFIKPRALFGLHSDVDIVGRYENIYGSLWMINIPHVSKANTSPGRNGRHYSTFYTGEGRRYVAERFGEEIERYGYAFEEAKAA